MKVNFEVPVPPEYVAVPPSFRLNVGKPLVLVTVTGPLKFTETVTL